MPMPFPAPAPASGARLDCVARSWSAVNEAARVIARMAGEVPEGAEHGLRHLPILFAACEPWRREAAERGIADLAAILEHGLAALLAIGSAGGHARAPARALWLEYCAARAALIALLPAGVCADPLALPGEAGEVFGAEAPPQALAGLHMFR